MRMWRGTVTVLTLLATLLGGQTIFRCLMNDSLRLNACHCSAPAQTEPQLITLAESSCCASITLPDQLTGTTIAEQVSLPVTSALATLPQVVHGAQLPAAPAACETARRTQAPPLYQQFCRILI